MKFILNYSLSEKNVTTIIDSITLEDIKEVDSNYSGNYNSNSILTSYEFNSCEIVGEIINNLTLQNNTRLVEILITNLTKHFQKIIVEIQNTQYAETDVESITKIYAKIIKNVIAATDLGAYKDWSLIYNNLESYNLTNAVLRSEINTIYQVTEMLNYMINKSIESNVKSNIVKGLQCYANCVVAHLLRNTPYEYTVSSNSIPINERYRDTLRKNRIHQSELVASLEQLASLTNDAISKTNDSNIIISSIWNYAHIMDIVFYHKHDSKSVKYQATNVILKNTLTLYRSAFEKPFNIGEDIVDTPFDPELINKLLTQTKELGYAENVLGYYLAWIKFIFSEYKVDKYSLYYVEMSTSIVGNILYLIKSTKNEYDVNSYIRLLDSIMDLYLSLNYTPDSISHNVAHKIHETFLYYQFEDKFTSTESQYTLTDSTFIQKCNLIINKTSWSYYGTVSPKRKIGERLFVAKIKLL